VLSLYKPPVGFKSFGQSYSSFENTANRSITCGQFLHNCHCCLYEK